MWGYRTRDVSRLLGLPAWEVRRYAREGLVSARRDGSGWRYGFQDLVLLRAAAELTRAQVPVARVRRALTRLRAQLPAGRSLAGVHISADGDQVVVREAGAAWQPESGQLLIDFDVRDVALQVAPLVDAPGPSAPARDAEDWYGLGCDLEAGAPEEAMAAYRRALDLQPGHAGASLNLGRLVQERGDPVAAAVHYEAARSDPALAAEAEFNTGVALEDQGRVTEALQAYERALSVDPGHADAHFNAARLLEAAGSRVDALRHLSAYRRLSR